MKNKRGFLLAEETLKIIIALISISFLVYFLTALYFANQNSEELEQAEASLEFLISEINDGRGEVLIYNPLSSTLNPWWISSWPSKVTRWNYIPLLESTYTGFPNTCKNLGWSSCLCVCKGKGDTECDEKGICKESSFEIKEGAIKIEDVPLTLNIEEGIITKK